MQASISLLHLGKKSIGLSFRNVTDQLKRCKSFIPGGYESIFINDDSMGFFCMKLAPHNSAQCLFSECNEDMKADRNQPRFYIAAKIIDTFFRPYIYMGIMLDSQASCRSMSQSPSQVIRTVCATCIIVRG